MMDIGFIGLGAMGAGIAANLVRAGHRVTVWNRTAAKSQPLVEAGAQAAASPGEAAAGKPIVLSMLADDAALDAALSGPQGLLEGLSRGALHISMATIAVATADRVADLHQAKGQRYVSAPVFGRPEAAAAAKLFVVAAGAAADLDEAEPLFQAVGQKVFRVGDRPSMANLIKLCGNFSILGTVEVLAEAMALAEKGGVPKAKLLEVMTGSLFGSPIVQTYGGILVEERFQPPGFKAPLALKDMRLAGQAAESSRVPMPVLAVVRDHLLQTIARDGEDIDWSALGKSVALNAGLKPKA
jgi:3-hydroxyisobutyrate dehydrogenase-like beta-hydroxyacid dehydrogenase